MDAPIKFSAALIMTLLRAFLVVPILCLLISHKPVHIVASMFLFCAALVTDILDGFFARRFSQVTPFGAYLDALVDKVLIYALLGFFFWKGIYSGLLIFISCLRDFGVSVLRSRRFSQGRAPTANQWGKLKFAFQSASVSLAFGSLIAKTSNPQVYASCANLLLLIALLISLPGVFILIRIPSSTEENN